MSTTTPEDLAGANIVFGLADAGDSVLDGYTAPSEGDYLWVLQCILTEERDRINHLGHILVNDHADLQELRELGDGLAYDTGRIVAIIENLLTGAGR